MEKSEFLTYEYLSKYFHYDPVTGDVKNKFIKYSDLPKGYKHSLEAWNRRKAFKSAYIKSKAGNNYTLYAVDYYTDTPNKKRLNGHRLAWLLYYGDWPKGSIDHVDGNPQNNKIENLRDCCNSVHNMQNRAPDKDRHLPRGVRFDCKNHTRLPTFRAWYRGDDGKDVNLYCGRDMFEAICARKSWENWALSNNYKGYTKRHFDRG